MRDNSKILQNLSEVLHMRLLRRLTFEGSHKTEAFRSWEEYSSIAHIFNGSYSDYVLIKGGVDAR